MAFHLYQLHEVRNRRHQSQSSRPSSGRREPGACHCRVPRRAAFPDVVSNRGEWIKAISGRCTAGCARTRNPSSPNTPQSRESGTLVGGPDYFILQRRPGAILASFRLADPTELRHDGRGVCDVLHRPSCRHSHRWRRMAASMSAPIRLAIIRNLHPGLHLDARLRLQCRDRVVLRMSA